MSKAKEFTIQESVSELIKSNRFKTRKSLTDYLGITTRTGERWTQKYKTKGIEGLLSDAPKKLKSRIITPEIHQGLSKRVNSSEDPFLGYWDAVQWVQNQFGVDVQYHNLRRYLIQHFKTKLKTPRKSHYKKDDKAVDAFLKTS
jgi:transposase